MASDGGKKTHTHALDVLNFPFKHKLDQRCIFFVILPPVLHGDVHHLCSDGGALVSPVCMLLEGSAQDPVLDRRSHFPWHVGESSLLC